MSAVLKPVEKDFESLEIAISPKLNALYTRYAKTLKTPKEELILKALDAFVEEMHDVAAVLEARRSRAVGQKGTPWDEIKRENNLV